MKNIGIKNVIWLTFFVTSLIVIITSWYVLIVSPFYFCQIAFLTIGLLVSIVQFSVAYTNATKKINPITRFLFRIYKNFTL
jgi:hypothetical protein